MFNGLGVGRNLPPSASFTSSGPTQTTMASSEVTGLEEIPPGDLLTKLDDKKALSTHQILRLEPSLLALLASPPAEAAHTLTPSYLRQIYQSVRRCARQCTAWSRPETLDGFGPVGWAPLVLKLHQMFARLQVGVKDRKAGAGAGAGRDGGGQQQQQQQQQQVQLQTNAMETMSLWRAMKQLAVDEAEANQHDIDAEDEMMDTTTSTTTTTTTTHTHKATANTSSTTKNGVAAGSSDHNVQEVAILVCLRSGAWRDLALDGGRGKSWPAQFDVKSRQLLVVYDLECLWFGMHCHGRYDAYGDAILCTLLHEGLCGGGGRDKDIHTHGESQQAGGGGMVQLQVPDILMNSPQMALARAGHALRVFRDASGTWRVTEEKAEWYLTLLTSSGVEAVNDTMADLEQELWHAQFNKYDIDCRKRLERLLVALLGHSERDVRNHAAILLNAFYDGHDWQLKSPFSPIVRSVGDAFTIEFMLEDDTDPQADATGPKGVFLILSAPSFAETAPHEVYSYHPVQWTAVSKVSKRDGGKDHRREHHRPANDPRFEAAQGGGMFKWKGHVRFGTFVRCGFYDWRVVKANVNQGSWIALQTTLSNIKRMGSQTSLNFDATALDILGQHSPSSFDTHRTFPLQGRFIVQSNNIGDEQIHEVFIDQHDAAWDKDTGELTKRGSFASVAASFQQLKECGVTTVYLMGALARDNGETLYTNFGEMTFERPDASPFAVTCRASPNEMLGGATGFQDLMREAKRVGIKVLVDSVARVSSSRPHRKYWPLVLHTLDQSGKRIMLYGSDGRSVSYEDSATLNYRNVSAWDLLVADIKSWANRYCVDGVRLDNAQVWPQILRAHQNELNRMDPDGQYHFGPEQRLLGEVVVPFTEGRSGFWDTKAAKGYANPLFVKLCREVWRDRKDFLIVGECWGGDSYEWRPSVLAKSGIVPQLQQLPYKLCQLFGKQITEDAHVVSSGGPSSILVLKEWFEGEHAKLPDGAFVIQSSCSHSSPLPGLLYGRGAWPAVDLLFLLPDIPSTFMGEMEGRSFRLDITNVFQTPEGGGEHMHAGSPEAANASAGGRWSAAAEVKLSRSLVNLADRGSPQPSFHSHDSAQTQKTGLLSKVRSLHAFENVTELPVLEERHVQAVGPQFGFDLKQIKSHYDHRRSLRHKYKLFRQGALLPLKAQVGDSWHQQILAFARYDVDTGEFALVVINFTDQRLDNVAVSLKILWPQFQNLEDSTPFLCIDTLAVPETQGLILALHELIHEPHILSIQPFATVCRTFREIPPQDRLGEDIQRQLYLSSLLRLETLIAQMKSASASGKAKAAQASSNLIITKLVAGLQNFESLDPLATTFDRIWEAMMSHPTKSPPTLYDICVDSGIFTESDDLACQLVACLQKLVDGAVRPTDGGETSEAASGAIKLAHQFLDHNKIGPIVFITPELGKWSTVGGLGVMVDELATTLAEVLGQEVWVISPYYDRNRKGETGYLQKDEIPWSFSMHVQVGHDKIGFGVYEKVIKGVRLFFIHNGQVFPQPYPDFNAVDGVKFLSALAKASLELMCQVRGIPKMVVTNDWPTGLVPAYARMGHFGDAFKDTTFFHIIHNLDPSYEGRIHANRGEDLAWVHSLPAWILVDENWAQYVLNPSRAALLKCDNWGTVSRSYLDDLCGRGSGQTSALCPLLNNFPTPFAFPNGVPVEARVSRLLRLGFKDHWEAKGAIQTKYFGFQQPDLDIPLFAFIGRITSQKGVHLILDAAENIIKRYNYRIQILVGGMANQRDPYSGRCAQKMWQLRNQFHFAFWADPNEFFSDGPLINIGADFGLMPSAFEPGGIVQHEFFVGGTPVIAFRTGGLKDTVSEFNIETQKGNGFTFEAYNVGDLLYAMERALRVFSDKSKYEHLRKNARASVITCEQVGRAWLGEFCRLRRKIAVTKEKMESLLSALPDWSEKEWRQKQEEGPISPPPTPLPGTQQQQPTPKPSPKTAAEQLSPPTLPVGASLPEDKPPTASSASDLASTPMSAVQMEAPGAEEKPTRGWVARSSVVPEGPGLVPSQSNLAADTMAERGSSAMAAEGVTAPGAPGLLPLKKSVSRLNLNAVRFQYVHPQGNRKPRLVSLSGSFDDWMVRRPMIWDNALQAFSLSMALEPGKYTYKLIIDGDWICNPQEQTEKDSNGNVNNVIVVT